MTNQDEARDAREEDPQIDPETLGDLETGKRAEDDVRGGAGHLSRAAAPCAGGVTSGT